MKHFKNIKTIFAVTLALLTVIVLTLQIGVSHYQFSKVLEEKVVQQLEVQGHNEAAKLNGNLVAVSKNVESLAETIEALHDYDKDTIFGVLNRILSKEPLIYGGGFWLEPFVYSAEKKYYGPYIFRNGISGKYELTWKYSNDTYDYFKYEWYKNGFKPGVRVAWSEPYIDQVSGVAMITTTSPIKKNGKVIGVTTIDIGIEKLIQDVNAIKIGESGYGFLISSNGLQIGSLINDNNLKINNTADNLARLKEIAIADSKEDGSGIMKTVLNNQEVVVVFTPVGETGLRLVLVMPVEEAFASVKRILMLNIILLVVSVSFLMLMILTLFENKVSAPLKRLTNHAMRISNDDFSAVIAVQSEDEIGQLCRSFNTMSETIKNSLETIRNANQALQISEERWQLVLRGNDNGIFDWKIQAKKIYFSPRAKELFGYDDVEVSWSLREWQEKIYPEDYVRIERLFKDHLAKKTDCFYGEYRFFCKDGTLRWALTRGRALWDEKNNPIRFVGDIADITRRKMAEEALLLAHDQLEVKVELRTQDLLAANQELQVVNKELEFALENLKQTQNQLVQSERMASLGNLVAGVAHEINTPMGVGVTAVTHLQKTIKEFAELYETGNLKRQDLEEYLADLKEAATIVFANLERASQLIRSFKLVSADQSSEVRRIFNVKQYLGELLLSLQPKLKRTPYKVIAHCEEDLEINSFPGAFGQIITNLLMNSLIHAFEPNQAGKISIEICKTESENIRITYSDDGKGMSSEVINQIFSPFFTTKREAGGTGLGLYILYNIVTQQFAGTIECESKLDKGATFIIEFPFGREMHCDNE